MRPILLLPALSLLLVASAWTCACARLGESSAAEAAPEREQAARLTQPLYASTKSTDIARGQTSAILERRSFIVRAPEHWQRVWREHTANLLPQPPAPEVDFERFMVVGMILGQRESGGYGLLMDGARIEDGALILDALETRPQPGQATTLALTSPFHFMRVTRSAGGVEFRVRSE